MFSSFHEIKSTPLIFIPSSSNSNSKQALFSLIISFVYLKDSSPKTRAAAERYLIVNSFPSWGENTTGEKKTQSLSIRSKSFSDYPDSTTSCHFSIGFINKNGAGDWIWTNDRLITNQELYQLSYASKNKIIYLFLYL